MRKAELELDTSSRQVVDITEQVQNFCAGEGDGLVSVFAPHSTTGLALIQPGDGSDADLVDAIERLVPRDARYRHKEKSPGHGADHIIPALISPSLVIPVDEGEPALGAFQRVVLVDMDVDSPRRRVRLSFLAPAAGD